MAFLQPENIPSRNDLPPRLQFVAKSFRDFLPEEVTVWLERTGDGDAAALRHDFDPAVRPPGGNASEAYLVVLDPAAGIAVVEAPAVPRARQQLLSIRTILTGELREEIARRASSLRHDLDAGALRSLPARHVLAFPQARREDLSAVESLRMLTEEDFTRETLAPVLRRLVGTRSRPLSEQEETAVRATVKPDIAIGEASQQGAMFHPPDDVDTVRALDRRQERLALHLGGGYRLIRGVAGSGKTLILTHRATHFGELLPAWRILLLCFNRALSHALAAEVKAIANVQVKTVDALAYGLLEDTGHPVRVDKKPDFEARRVAALPIAHALDDRERFDMVFVDEAQDLGPSGLDLAWAMLRTGRDHFVIALDSAQNVYRRRMAWNPPGMTARGRATVLTVNYRNTKEILDPALEVLRGATGPEATDHESDDPDILVMPDEAVRHGVATAMLACADMRTEVQHAVEKVRQLQDAGAEADHIVVLSGSREFRKEVITRLPAAVDAGRARDGGVDARGRIRVATLQLLKGLEFRHVIVGGANDVWVTEDDARAQDDQRRRLLYVAMTRATESLTISYSGSGLMNQIESLPRRAMTIKQ